MELNADRFDEFFDALWMEADSPREHMAFPWQRELARTVFNARWPSAIVLPTAAGKTAVLDIAIYHLALEARSGPERRAPLRILFVVDRRLVVDDAWRRACYIAKRLRDAKSGILAEVAAELRFLADSPAEEKAMPLAVARLRGGMPRDTDWARTPNQPLVVCSTIDQVGSRLLFRGYGVSDSMKPVHAGLVGSDALWVVDEAHLSQAFRETLDAIIEYRRHFWDTQGYRAPFAFVSLTATPTELDEARFGLAGADWNDEVLRARLCAHKHADLAELKDDDEATIVREFADRALALLAPGEGGAIGVAGVVVNRVRLARAIHDELRQRLNAKSGETDVDVELLIGRVRPLDRDRKLNAILPRMRARNRKDGRKLLVVATQTVEVGADLDFDALVTQLAPIDALRQRFGRLNRIGRRESASANIIATKNDLAKGKNADPIYGEASLTTWRWLVEHAETKGRGRNKRGTVDFSVAYFPEIEPDALSAMLTPRAPAPVLVPEYLTLWAQTSPIPTTDPEPRLFLHGYTAGRPDVSLIWRCDLAGGEDIGEVLGLVPPSPLEAVSVPIAELRRWGRRIGDELADLEGVGEPDYPQNNAQQKQRFWRYHRGKKRWEMAELSDLAPGDTLVVAASVGGCDEHGWNPKVGQGERDVEDIAEEAHLVQRRRVMLRVTRPTLRQALSRDARAKNEVESLWARIRGILDEAREEGPKAIVDALCAIRGELPELWESKLKALSQGRQRVVYPYGEEIARNGCILIGQRKLTEAEVQECLKPWLRAGEDISDDEQWDEEGSAITDVAASGNEGSFLGREVGLEEHSNDAERFARRYAEALSLPKDYIDTISLAAHLHDFGKAEPRFQAMLHGGDSWAVDPARPLAKSNATTREARRLARELAGLPSGARHECWSVRLAQGHADVARSGRRDLLLWLIGTHHGQGRPFFEPIRDNVAGTFSVWLGDELHADVQHELASIASGWVERFERLQRAYDPWELARLEAIVRLADHRCSEWEQERREKETNICG